MDKKIQRAFDTVHAGDTLKDNTADFVHKKLYARAHRTALRRAVPAVCCALLILLALTGYGVYSIPVAAISVEAAETVELKINAFDRVVSYTCLSPGGQAAVDALGLTHCTYGDAVAALVENGGDAEASVSIAAGSTEKNAALSAEIETHCAGVNCQATGAETLEAASAAGLGVRRYEAYLEWKALDQSVTPEDAQSLSMREIRERISALLGENSDSESDAAGAQNGGGQQCGAGMHSGSGQANGTCHGSGTRCGRN